jgi:hypothetical protein
MIVSALLLKNEETSRCTWFMVVGIATLGTFSMIVFPVPTKRLGHILQEPVSLSAHPFTISPR